MQSAGPYGQWQQGKQNSSPKEPEPALQATPALRNIAFHFLLFDAQIFQTFPAARASLPTHRADEKFYKFCENELGICTTEKQIDAVQLEEAIRLYAEELSDSELFMSAGSNRLIVFYEELIDSRLNSYRSAKSALANPDHLTFRSTSTADPKANNIAAKEAREKLKDVVNNCQALPPSVQQVVESRMVDVEAFAAIKEKLEALDKHLGSVSYALAQRAEPLVDHSRYSWWSREHNLPKAPPPPDPQTNSTTTLSQPPRYEDIGASDTTATAAAAASSTDEKASSNMKSTHEDTKLPSYGDAKTDISDKLEKLEIPPYEPSSASSSPRSEHRSLRHSLFGGLSSKGKARKG